MANRNWGNAHFSNLQSPVRIDFQWTELAAAPGGVMVHRGRFVTSVTRTGVGLFSVLFPDIFTQLYSVSGIVVGVLAAVDQYVQVAAYAPAAAGGATLDLRIKTAGAQADPADGDEVFIETIWSNSQLNP